MAPSGGKPPESKPRLVLSKDVRISEKRGISRARDAKTGKLLSKRDEQTSQSKPPSRITK